MNKTQEALKMAITQFERIDKEYDCTEIIDICKEALEQSSWKKLTDDEIQYLKSNYASYTLYDEGEYGTEVELDVEDFARAVEHALRIKNT